MIFSSHTAISKAALSAKHISYSDTICFESIPASAREGVQFCSAAAVLKAPSLSAFPPVYSSVFFCSVAAQSCTCSSKISYTCFCVMEYSLLI